jgi:hypothetical protein
VAEVMRYVLFKSHQTSGCPIKREELTGIITRNYRQRVLPTLVINEARDRLAATFGYEMRELQRTRAPSTRSGRSTQPQRKGREKKKKLFFCFLFLLLGNKKKMKQFWFPPFLSASASHYSQRGREELRSGQ